MKGSNPLPPTSNKPAPPPNPPRHDAVDYAWRALHGKPCPLATVDSRSAAVTAYREKQRQLRKLTGDCK